VTRRLLLVCAVVLAAVPFVGPVRAAVAQEQTCELDPITLHCRVGVPVTRPSTPGGSDTPEGPTSPGGRGPAAPPPPDPGSGNVRAECDRWVQETGPAAEQYLASVGAPAGWAAYICDGGARDGQRAAFAPGDEPVQVSAEQVAADLWAEVQTTMTAPTVSADPPVGTASIVTLPVFVEVTNWQGVQRDENCVGGVCVEIVATPTLLFYPGEPDAPPIVCDPPGTRFDPGGAEPDVQAAAPGACAYVYTLRSGVDGRPGEWPAEVRVTWDVQWTSNVPGPEGSGSFDPMSLATAIPRQVNEVQTVVVEGSTN
jgi:hypothetical protein